MSAYIIVTGNPVDGFSFTGPFEDQEAATDAAFNGEYEGDWWVAPLEPPDGPVGAWHVNVYMRDRAYGGPEEGGWWYDTGTFAPSMSVILDQATYSPVEANEYARNLQERLNEEADRDGIPPVGTSSYRGGRYLVQTDDKAGADFPATRPHYE